MRHGRRRAGGRRTGWCDLFNLRLSKCGGFIPTLRLAQFAKRHGLGYQLGCQVGETAILSAAGRHFATSVERPALPRRLLRPAPGREYALGDEDITFGRGGWAPALVRTRARASVDPGDCVDRLTVRKEVLIG